MSFIMKLRPDSTPVWFPKDHPQAANVFGLKPAPPGKLNYPWRHDVREQYLRKHPQYRTSKDFKVDKKKTIYLRYWKYQCKVKQSMISDGQVDRNIQAGIDAVKEKLEQQKKKGKHASPQKDTQIEDNQDEDDDDQDDDDDDQDDDDDDDNHNRKHSNNNRNNNRNKKQKDSTISPDPKPQSDPIISDLSDDDQSYGLSLKDLQAKIMYNDDKNGLYRKYKEIESDDEFNQEQLSVITAVGLNWKKLFKEKISKDSHWPLTAEDLKPQRRRETYGQLIDRKSHTLNDQIYSKHNYKEAGLSIQQKMNKMHQTAKVKYFNKFIVNANDHVWECFFCNPLCFYLINRLFKCKPRSSKKKKKSKKAKYIGEYRPTLEDFGIPATKGNINAIYYLKTCK